MAGQLKHGFALHGVIKQFESLSFKGFRHAHTHVASGLQSRPLPTSVLVRVTIDEHRPQVPPLQNPHPSLFFSPLNQTEIREKNKPVAIIKTPQIPGIDTSISDPTLGGIKPMKTPVINRIVIKPPTVNTPKSASKNGNLYILKLKRKKIKKRKLEKVRMRAWPLTQKIEFLREQKQKRQFKALLESFQKKADSYNYLAIVKQNLSKAKKNGYYHDMFGPEAETFDFFLSKKVEQKVEKEERDDLGGLLSKLSFKEQKKE